MGNNGDRTVLRGSRVSLEKKKKKKNKIVFTGLKAKLVDLKIRNCGLND